MTVWLLALVGVVFLGMRAWWMWRGRDVQRVSVRTFHHGTSTRPCWARSGAQRRHLGARGRRPADAAGGLHHRHGGAGGIALAPCRGRAGLCGHDHAGRGGGDVPHRRLVNALIALLFIGYALVVLGAAFNNCRQMLLLRGSRDEVDRQREVVSLLLRDFEDNASDALWKPTVRAC